MVSITERFSTLQLQSLKAMQAYTLASLNGVEKLAELNLQAAKTTVEEGRLDQRCAVQFARSEGPC